MDGRRATRIEFVLMFRPNLHGARSIDTRLMGASGARAAGVGMIRIISREAAPSLYYRRNKAAAR